MLLSNMKSLTAGWIGSVCHCLQRLQAAEHHTFLTLGLMTKESFYYVDTSVHTLPLSHSSTWAVSLFPSLSLSASHTFLSINDSDSAAGVASNKIVPRHTCSTFLTCFVGKVGSFLLNQSVVTDTFVLLTLFWIETEVAVMYHLSWCSGTHLLQQAV